MSNRVRIRRANLKDIWKLAGLFDLYRQFYHKESDVLGAEQFLSERMQKGESVVFVAEMSGGALCGFVQLYPSFTSLGMARSWILNDLYVVEDARRLGVARLLMSAAHELANSTGAHTINLETQMTNTEAQSLYQSLGYEVESEFLLYSKVVRPPT